MRISIRNPQITICVLTYGDYFHLIRQCLESIFSRCNRRDYMLYVGSNAASAATRAYLEDLFCRGAIDRVYDSEININKCPMMRHMFTDVKTDFIWWLDDDSYICDEIALPERIRIVAGADPKCVLWGHEFYANHEKDFNRGEDMVKFVELAPWFRGKAPPCWAPGGKGVNTFKGRLSGDGRWFFMTGGSWVIRTATVRQLDWPPAEMIKCADDVFLSEAIRQYGFCSQNIGPLGMVINSAHRRGDGEDSSTMRQQFSKGAHN